ncbi:adenylate/guanylate cyclase domain-containing protein [Peribacillus saganii]|uniref:Adenylate/guanylate cyclase domain-containing protein n=1 Tax=Peribacillus saganii TaxID=2303992 RepID=A0A372LP63_9BACI|nr:adenylate/guanylate cyclase domain-containing protein [Peribacillus saganii]RFU69539.1 adenylate/guanylate cyclase domain-containing protein [Peribacillus saganii]
MKLAKNILVGLIIGAVLSCFYIFHTFYMIENNFTDRLTSFTDEKEVDYRIKILAIDEASLSEIGKWPWSRDVLAETAEKIAKAGATAVWTDVLYTEKSELPKEDSEWNRIAKQYPNVYLSAYFKFPPRQQSFQAEELLWPIYEPAPEQVGHINTFPDRDQIVRQVTLGVKDEEKGIVPAISVRLANRLLDEKKQITWDEQGNFYAGDKKLSTGNRNNIYFQYFSSAQKTDVKSFEVFSIKDVINGKIDPSYFTDSVVLIGPYATGLSDQYRTPTSRTLEMFGVEIHANIIQSMLNQDFYQTSSKTVGVVLIFLISIVGYLLFVALRPKWGGLLSLIMIACYVGISLIVFLKFSILLPFIYVVMGIITSCVLSIVTQYVRELGERKRVTGIFGRYVSKSVVDEILAAKNEIAVGGIRKEVTLMFVDIRGFTPLSEKMEPEEVVGILNEYLDLGAQAIFKYEGTIDKFIGDGIMAIFGAPIEYEDHAIRAANAALFMKKEADRLAQQINDKYQSSVAFGIGLNTGPAVIGNIGSSERMDYTAIGDTVNLAARLESNAKPNQILMSENTYQIIQQHFVCTPLQPIKVKGKAEPVVVYELEAERVEVQ